MPGGAPASRYDTILKLASGGMATVYVGTVRGALGFRQLVAIKKPHPHLVADPSFRNEIVAEARLASMIHHANVVDVRDVEVDGESISLVMDYIEGASLGELIHAASLGGKTLPPRVAVRVTVDALAGLHAAHELVDERDRPVGLVHRDVSPQNILVGTDGMARVADFGVAKFARKNMASTSDGSLKGKLAYMAPEYLRGEAIDRRFDLYAMGIVLWEALVGVRCFRADNEAETLQRLLSYQPEPISRLVPAIGPALDAILACALAKPRDERFLNAAAMGAALESAAGAAGLLAGHAEVAATVRALVGEAIDARRALVRAKLANEPSVASLMGVPELVQKTVAVGVGGAAAGVARADPPPPTLPLPQVLRPGSAPEIGPATQPLGAAPGVVPATLPMTPRVEDAQLRGAANGAREPARSPSVRTHASEGSGAGSAAVARSYTADYTHPVAGARAPQRRWVLPVVVGVVTAVVAAAAIRYGVASLGAREGAPATAPSSIASTSGTASTAAAVSAAGASSAGASSAGAPSAGASVASASSGAAPTAPSAAAFAPRTSGRVVHPGAPSSSARKPPPNPYATPE